MRDGAEPLTTLAMLAEVTPVLRRDGAKADLEMQFGLGNLLAIKPQLDLPTPTALTRAVARWLPASMRSKVPPSMLAAAAEELGAYLLGAAYQRVRATLLPRLGEVTRLRLHLPEVPVASVAVRSLWADPASGERASLEPLAESVTFAPAPSPDALAIEILTDLPVRRGLPPPRSAVVPSDISIALSVSAAAELGTWAIEHGLLPRWYSRGLKPSDRGEFRPRLDYVAEDRAHPFKVHLFQERGGCSYFRVGVRASIAMEGPALVVSTSDRVLEQVVAAPLLEVAAWVKYVLTGWIDESKRVVARTQLSIGPQSFATEVVGALLADDQLEFSLRLTPAPAPAPRLR